MEVSGFYRSDTGLCDFEISTKDSPIHYRSYCASLVLDYINKDYASIANAPLHDKEHEGIELIRERYFYTTGWRDLEYWKNMPEIEADLSSLDYDLIKSIIDLVFVSEDFPSLSCVQKYFALECAFTGRMTELSMQYEVKISPFAAPQPKPIKKDAMLDYYDFEWVDKIINKGLPVHETYKNICHEILSSQLSVSLVESYVEFEFLSHAVLFLLHETIKQNCKIQICPNCNKYFVPYFRKGTVFCDNRSPQDYKKTCSEYRKYLNYLTKTQTDVAMKLYKQIYNIKNNKVRRCKTTDNPAGNPIVNADFEQFVSTVAQWKSDIKAGIRPEADYVAWLREVKER